MKQSVARSLVWLLCAVLSPGGWLAAGARTPQSASVLAVDLCVTGAAPAGAESNAPRASDCSHCPACTSVCAVPRPLRCETPAVALSLSLGETAAPPRRQSLGAGALARAPPPA